MTAFARRAEQCLNFRIVQSTLLDTLRPDPYSNALSLSNLQ